MNSQTFKKLLRALSGYCKTIFVNFFVNFDGYTSPPSRLTVDKELFGLVYANDGVGAAGRTRTQQPVEMSPAHPHFFVLDSWKLKILSEMIIGYRTVCIWGKP